jgi:hypothetical protein
MKIENVQKGKRPTLLEADKANEVIDHVNSLSGTVVVRGGDADKFIFGKEKTTLQLQDFPSQDVDIESADQSVIITETDTGHDLKALTLNDLKAKDVDIVSNDLSIDIDEVNEQSDAPQINLKGLTLNGIKAKNATLKGSGIANVTTSGNIVNVHVDPNEGGLTDIRSPDQSIDASVNGTVAEVKGLTHNEWFFGRGCGYCL